MSFRHRIYAGEILVISRNRAGARLTQIAEGILCDEFGEPNLPMYFARMSPAALKVSLERGRSIVYSNPEVIAQVWKVISSLGEDPRQYRMDPPRLRVVLPAGHSAGPKKTDLHRDVWFAEPRNQINLWMPLCNFTRQALGIWPEYFTAPIKNTSQCLNRQRWEQALARGHIKYPQALEHPAGPYKSFDLNKSEILAFSANHLHCALHNVMQRPRISIDFRIVHIRDYLLGLGPPMLDSRSRGSTFPRMQEYRANTRSSKSAH
jgi:hypothetical protein